VTADTGRPSLFALVLIQAAMPHGFAYATSDKVTSNSTQQKENLD